MFSSIFRLVAKIASEGFQETVFTYFQSRSNQNHSRRVFFRIFRVRTKNASGSFQEAVFTGLYVRARGKKSPQEAARSEFSRPCWLGAKHIVPGSFQEAVFKHFQAPTQKSFQEASRRPFSSLFGSEHKSAPGGFQEVRFQTFSGSEQQITPGGFHSRRPFSCIFGIGTKNRSGRPFSNISRLGAKNRSGRLPSTCFQGFLGSEQKKRSRRLPGDRFQACSGLEQKNPSRKLPGARFQVRAVRIPQNRSCGELNQKD